MNQPLTRAERRDTILRQIRIWLDHGLCENCALILVAKDLKEDYGRIKGVWQKAENPCSGQS